MHPNSPTWLQLNVALSRDGRSARESARRLFETLEPRINVLRSEGRVIAFYFMRKPPDVRLRFLGDDEVRADLGGLLDALEGEGVVQRWFPSVYEPETARFGGPEAMAAVHAWFDADTRCWLGLERLRSETGAALTAEALCVTVAHDLVSRAVDGRAEAWDVWQSYAAERGAPTTEGPLVTALPDMRALGERASPAEATTLAEYSAANEALAQALRDAWSSGRLARGLRAVVGTVVLFHFHRHGLSADAHAALASTMARLLVPSPQ